MALNFALDKSFWLLIAVLWMLPWKGWALWRAARNGQKVWFTVFMLVYSLGILEIIYLTFWSGLRWNREKKPEEERGKERKKRKGKRRKSSRKILQGT